VNLISMWKQAYLNCVPVTRRLDSIGIDGPSTIKRIREIDPCLQICWDTSRHTVVIWRIVDGIPYLVRDNPFGREVDHRLVHFLIANDTQRYGGREKFQEHRQQALQALKEEDQRRRWNAIDHGRLYHEHQKVQAQLNGAPTRLFSQVPGDRNASL